MDDNIQIQEIAKLTKVSKHKLNFHLRVLENDFREATGSTMAFQGILISPTATESVLNKRGEL